MLSRTAEYALRAVLHIAERESEGPQGAAGIAGALNVPGNYLSKVLRTLAAEGVLRSRRGNNGGFFLAQPADRVTLARVIQPFDPVEQRCLLMRRRCDESRPCAAHDGWREIAGDVRHFFQRTTIADLVRNGHGNGAVVRFPT